MKDSEISVLRNNGFRQVISATSAIPALKADIVIVLIVQQH